MCERPGYLEPSQYTDATLAFQCTLKVIILRNLPSARPLPAVMSMLSDLRNAGRRVWGHRCALANDTGPEPLFPFT